MVKKLFRPIVLFKNHYVDLSLLTVSIIFLILLGIVCWSYRFDPIMDPWMLGVDVGVGMLIGAGVVQWELLRYKKKETKDVFDLSYIPSTVDTIFIMLNTLIKRDDWELPVFAAWCGYQVSSFICLLIIERRINKRFRWIEFYPK